MKRRILIIGLIIITTILSGCGTSNNTEENYAPVISSDELISVSYVEEPLWTDMITITDYEDGYIRPTVDMFDIGHFDSLYDENLNLLSNRVNSVFFEYGSYTINVSGEMKIINLSDNTILNSYDYEIVRELDGKLLLKDTDNNYFLYDLYSNKLM
jgi:hypothetical protein